MRPVVRQLALVAAITLFVAGLSASPVAADETTAAGSFPAFIPFDRAAGEHPEGVAVDKTGAVYVSFDAPRGEIRRFAKDGSGSLLIDFGNPGALGLAVDATGQVYVAREAAGRGVYRVAPSGDAHLVPGTDAILFPNGLAFDKQGNLYITETFSRDAPLADYPGCDVGFGSSFGRGGIWRVAPGGSATLWLRDELLTGVCAPTPIPYPVGANGIVYRDGALYVNSTERGLVVRVPIRSDGSPGDPEVFASVPDTNPPSPFGPSFLDGLSSDVHGNLYAVVINQSRVVRISPDGSTVDTVGTAVEGLDFPASLAFGTGNGERQTVFVTDYAIGPPGGAGPGLVKLDMGVPGQPLP